MISACFFFDPTPSLDSLFISASNDALNVENPEVYLSTIPSHVVNQPSHKMMESVWWVHSTIFLSNLQNKACQSLVEFRFGKFHEGGNILCSDGVSMLSPLFPQPHAILCVLHGTSRYSSPSCLFYFLVCFRGRESYRGWSSLELQDWIAASYPARGAVAPVLGCWGIAPVCCCSGLLELEERAELVPSS